MTSQWGAIATIAVFVMGNMIFLARWIGRSDAMFTAITKGLEEAVLELKAFRGIYVTKEQFAANHALHEKELDAIWKRLDALKNVGGGYANPHDHTPLSGAT